MHKPIPAVPDWPTLIDASPRFGGRSTFIDPDQLELLDAVNECRACGRLKGSACTCNNSEDS